MSQVPVVQSEYRFALEDDDRFFQTFSNPSSPVHPQWHMVHHPTDTDTFGQIHGFYHTQLPVDPYPQPEQYTFPQYSYPEASSSLTYGTPTMPYLPDATLPLSNYSELAHAQDMYHQPSLSDFSSSSSPETVLYSPVEETHQHYAESQYLPTPPPPVPSAPSLLPETAESSEDMPSPDSKPSLKRRRPTDYPPPRESSRSYNFFKIPLEKHSQPPAPKISKTRTPAQEKKSLALACFFCRGRKIACGRQDPNSPDRTCNQCYRRSLKCEYPTESRRGMRKKKPVVADNLRTLAAD
ncbi:hypothetical protein D9758_000418 [Tetrapyrgos nigripes]|uniref:Zn(2)-C6 fungal-type domain-containing protein n=1 Tax=Tetrapyrgos nigripes TaxID=182062 RepID=A0A8H5H1B5_9AGAR|nr:hypothetical protein D9758_000418 [Tetrapyrgos nigripes]